jgi:hypothetical protein
VEEGESISLASSGHGGGGGGLVVVGGADGGGVRGAVPMDRLPDLLHPGIYFSPETLTNS